MKILDNNALCPVCGKAYRVCRNCAEARVTTWKNVADSVQCFKVFTVLHGVYVTKTITKEDAKEKLAEFDLTDLKGYPEAVAEQIRGIIGTKEESRKFQK